MQLHKGDAFGELALIYDSVRSATIITTDYTDLIVLDKDNFRKHIRVNQREMSIIYLDCTNISHIPDHGFL